MVVKIVIKKLEDLREYCSEKVGMYGEESEWSDDVKALDLAIGMLKGTALVSYDAARRKFQKSLSIAIWVMIGSTLLNGIGILISVIRMFY